MSAIEAFNPQGNTILIIATTTASAATQVSTGNVSGIRIATIGAATAYVAIGSSTVQAVLPTSSTPATGIPLLSNSAETFSARPGSYVSAITTSGTQSIYATAGEGV